VWKNLGNTINTPTEIVLKGTYMEMINALIEWILEISLAWGYAGVFLGMALQSSFLPFASEPVLIPAGYHIAKGEFHWIPMLIAATAGSLTGSLVNYFVAKSVGRAFIVRYGKYVFISEKNLDRAENFFKKHGEIATLVCRLIPGVRQFISLPAGLANMNLFRFCLYTSIGAGFWCGILLFIGYAVGDSSERSNALVWQAIIGCIVLAGILVAGYIWKIKEKSSTNTEKKDSHEP